MEVLIDLGEMAPAEAPPDPPPPGARPVRHRRRTWLVLLAVLALLAVGAAAAPTDPMPRLFSITARGDAPIAFSGDRVFAIDGVSVVAYSLDTGARLWLTPASLVPGQGWSLQVVGDTVMLTNYSDYGDSGIVAFDARTGVRLWSRPANIMFTVPYLRGALIADNNGGWLRMIDMVTGVERWATADDGCTSDVDDPVRPTVWVRICTDGTLRTTDLRTGEVTHRVVVDTARHDLFVDEAPRMAVAYGTVVVSTYHSTTFDWTMTAYDLADLRIRWAGKPIDPSSWLLPCPPANVCTTNDRASDVISLASGDVVGSAPPFGNETVRPVDVTGSLPDSPPAVVLAPYGAPLDTQGRDAVVFVFRNGDYLSAPRYVSANDTWVVDARPDRTAATGYRFAPIGKIRGVYASRCVAYARTAGVRLLVCATARDTLTFWSVPPVRA